MMYEEMIWESFVKFKGTKPHRRPDGEPEGLHARFEFYHFKGGFEAALHSVEAEKEPEWISCEDRLPTDLDADMADHVFVANEFDVDVSIWSDLRNPAYRQNWSHWMPTGLIRPAPPEHKPE